MAHHQAAPGVRDGRAMMAHDQAAPGVEDGRVIGLVGPDEPQPLLVRVLVLAVVEVCWERQDALASG
eukprot:11994724-Heterocapsa_arctica.AAC.2